MSLSSIARELRTVCLVALCPLAAYNSQMYFVFGQVSQPGPKRWTGRDTLLSALATANTTRLAWAKRVIVIRGDGPQVGGRICDPGNHGQYASWGVHPEQADSKRRKMTVNALAMIQHGDMSNNILLQPGNVIYVQPTPLASIGLAMQSLLFPISPAATVAQTPAQVATTYTTFPPR